MGDSVNEVGRQKGGLFHRTYVFSTAKRELSTEKRENEWGQLGKSKRTFAYIGVIYVSFRFFYSEYLDNNVKNCLESLYPEHRSLGCICARTSKNQHGGQT